jgi:hypothetical protein
MISFAKKMYVFWRNISVLQTSNIDPGLKKARYCKFETELIGLIIRALI